MKKELYIKIRQIFFVLFNGLGSIMPRKNYIICYHSFSRVGNSYSIAPSIFKKQILSLSSKFSFVSLDEIFKANKRNCIALTVDDGYEDVLSIMPFIEKYKIPLTIFVLGNPQQANRNELSHPGKLLNFSQLKLLQKKGVTIGCHSMTHANFGSLNSKQLRKEIVDSKKILENKLGTKIQYFAFPKGIYTKEALKYVKQSGYKAAFTVSSGAVNGIDFLTPRTIIDQFYSVDEIHALLNPMIIKVKNFLSKMQLWRVMPSI